MIKVADYVDNPRSLLYDWQAARLIAKISACTLCLKQGDVVLLDYEGTSAPGQGFLNALYRFLLTDAVIVSQGIVFIDDVSKAVHPQLLERGIAFARHAAQNPDFVAEMHKRMNLAAQAATGEYQADCAV